MSTVITDGKQHSWLVCQFMQKLMKNRDNEKPLRRAKVHAFQAQGRPITNEEVSYYCQLALDSLKAES